MTTRDPASGWNRVRRARVGALALVAAVASGCMLIGPDYERPKAPVGDEWVVRNADDITQHAEPIGPWWETFGDPVLTNLIVEAYRGNPSLQAAGVRVLEAQARRGISIGTLFPQTQNAVGGYRRIVASKNGVTQLPGGRYFNEFVLGFDAAWELDLWGKFR